MQTALLEKMKNEYMFAKVWKKASNGNGIGAMKEASKKKMMK